MIGKVPLDQLAKDKGVVIEWKSFELRPEDFEVPEKSAQQIAQAKSGLEALGRKYGLIMTFNEKSKHSRKALEGAKFAEDHGFGDAYHDAVFAAQFQEQKDINDLNSLTEIAGQIKLDHEKFKEALVTKQYEQAVLQDLAEAQRLGIQGVPYYIVEGRKANGVQSYEALEKLLQGNATNTGIQLKQT